METEFEAVIGLEIHTQLATESKIFCACRARLPKDVSVADEEVNGNTCPVCAGHPGTLPVLNEKVLEYAVRAGLALGCRIQQKSVFARKNYFYPDLPKGYQISQYDRPICEDGSLEIELADGTQKRIGIERIHMEEDAGKNQHMSGFSLVNLNRAGVPLIEIVSRPELKTPEEAGAYMRAMYAVVTYLGICDGNLQEGNFRCDANVSVMPRGSKKFGTRTEIKNVNSFRFVEKAIEYEIARQIEIVKSGGQIVQETRGFDSAKGTTFSQRSKEEAHDYRYFPDPDLLAIRVSSEQIEKIRASLPELPEAKRKRYIRDYQLSSYDAGELTASQSVARFFENTLLELEKRKFKPGQVAKATANLLAGEITRLLNEEGISIESARLTSQHLADLVVVLQNNEISSSAAKQVIGAVWKSGDSVAQVVEREGLKQVSDSSVLEKVIDQVIQNFPAQVEEYKGGKVKVLSFLVGQAMKLSAGKANPAMLQELFNKKLK